MNSPMRRMLSNKSLWVKTFAYYAAFTALGLTTASLGPTLPGLAASTHSDLSRISFLFVLRSLGYLLGSYNAGRLYDQRTGNPIIAVALTGIAALLTFVPVIPILWIVAALLLLVGFAEGTVDVGGNTLMVWLHRDQVGPFMNGLHFTFGVGALLSPIIIAQTIAHSGGIRWAYWVLAVLIAPMAIWIFRIPSPPSQGSDPSVSIKPRRPLLVGLVLLFFFLYVGAETGYGGWIYTYAISTGLGSATSAAYLNSGFWAALTLGRLAAIPLSTRLRPPDVLAIDLLGCLASLTTVLAFPASQAAL
jgi:FHS family Na+ dependent glucose MFS transporter 1